MHGQLLKLTFAGSIKIDSVLPSYNTFRTAGCIFIAAMASSLAVFNFCLFLSKSKIVWLFKCVTGTCSLFLVQTNFSLEEVVLMVLACLYWLDSTIFIVVTGLWTRVHKVQLLVVLLLLLFLACGLLMWTLSHNPSEVPVLTVPSPLPFSNMFTRQNEHVAVCLELHYTIQLDIGTYIVTSAPSQRPFTGLETTTTQEWQELFDKYIPPPYSLPGLTGAYSFGMAGEYDWVGVCRYSFCLIKTHKQLKTTLMLIGQIFFSKPQYHS